jgi:hypothetical protein
LKTIRCATGHVDSAARFDQAGLHTISDIRIDHVVVINGNDVGAARPLEEKAVPPDDVQIVLDAPETNACITCRQISTDLLCVRSMRPIVEQHPFEIVVALAQDRISQRYKEQRIDVVNRRRDRKERLAFSPRPAGGLPEREPGLFVEHPLEPSGPAFLGFPETDPGDGVGASGRLFQRDDVVALGQRGGGHADEHAGHVRGLEMH